MTGCGKRFLRKCTSRKMLRFWRIKFMSALLTDRSKTLEQALCSCRSKSLMERKSLEKTWSWWTQILTIESWSIQSSKKLFLTSSFRSTSASSSSSLKYTKKLTPIKMDVFLKMSSVCSLKRWMLLIMRMRFSSFFIKSIHTTTKRWHLVKLCNFFLVIWYLKVKSTLTELFHYLKSLSTFMNSMKKFNSKCTIRDTTKMVTLTWKIANIKITTTCTMIWKMMKTLIVEISINIKNKSQKCKSMTCKVNNSIMMNKIMCKSENTDHTFK